MLWQETHLLRVEGASCAPCVTTHGLGQLGAVAKSALGKLPA